jgi:hypothetical protein
VDRFDRGAAGRERDRRETVTRRRAGRILAAALAGLISAATGLFASDPSSPAAGPADTSLVWTWSALYRSRLYIDRESRRFPWNDEAERSSLNDRLAFLGELSSAKGVSIFAKGATGYRLSWPYQDEQLILDQGHIGFDLLGGGVSGRIFARERVYRTDQRLIALSSDDRWFADVGEGLAVELSGANGSLRYVESMLRYDFARRGGLPSFGREEDYLRLLRLEMFQRPRWHVGLTISELRESPTDDWFTVGADCGLAVGGVDFLAELASVHPGGWEDFTRGTPFPLSWDKARLDDVGAIFSRDEAFAAEIEGLALSMGRLGTAGIVPGYRYTGRTFDDVQGNGLPAGLRETYGLAWWKPARYDALVSVEAASGATAMGDLDRLIGGVRARYRGGFELRESVLCEKGERSSAAVSFIDDNDLSRLAVTARVDDLGDRNALSYLARGTFNLGSRVTAKSALFLFRSGSSRYNLELEFRPAERFLFQVSAGSFIPTYEGLTIDRSLEFYPYPAERRFIQLFARVWFGGGSTR